MSFFAGLTAAVKIKSRNAIIITRLPETGPATIFEKIDDSTDEASIKQLLLLPPLLPPLLEAVLADRV